MDLVVMVLVFAPQESQVSQGVPDPRDQRVLRDRLALKDPWAQEETKDTMANPGAKVLRDLKGPWAQQDHRGPKVTKVSKEAKARLALRDLRGHFEVTGNSAFLKD